MAREYTSEELREEADRHDMPMVARNALRFVADLFDLSADTRYSLEAIGLRVRNQLNEL